MNIILVASIWCAILNLGILGLNIKLYTEIMKEKAQRGRHE